METQTTVQFNVELHSHELATLYGPQEALQGDLDKWAAAAEAALSTAVQPKERSDAHKPEHPERYFMVSAGPLSNGLVSEDEFKANRERIVASCAAQLDAKFADLVKVVGEHADDLCRSKVYACAIQEVTVARTACGPDYEGKPDLWFLSLDGGHTKLEVLFYAYVWGTDLTLEQIFDA